MSRLRLMTLLLALAFVAALAVGGELTGQNVAAQVQQPLGHGPGLTSTSWVRCGSVLSPTGSQPDTGWVYSDKSCSRKLTELRTAAWRWLAGTVTVFSLIALVAALARRSRGSRRPETDLISSPASC